MNWKKLLVKDELSVKDILKRMDAGGEKILFIVGEHDRLKGVITDGDIRRHFLSHGSLDEQVGKIYNPEPLYVFKGYDRQDVKQLMANEKIEVVPVVDQDKHVIGALSWTDIFGKENIMLAGTVNVPVVIMAGGKGKRLDPFTKILPKPLIPVGEKPIIEIIMDEFNQYGVEDFYVTLNYKGEMIKIYFANAEKEYNVRYVREEEFLGTAGSLKLLPENIGDTFIVSNCDIIVNIDYGDLIKFHKDNGNCLTIVGSIQHHRIPYGVIDFEKEGKLKKIEEKPELDFTVNTGVYVLSKKVVDAIPENKHFDMTDLIQALMDDKENIGVYPVSQKSYIDIGQWEEYKKHIENLVI